MNYVNADLRKNNLLLDFFATTAKLFHAPALATHESVEKPAVKAKLKGESANDDSKEYYANSPKRVGKAVSIDRKLAASGNVW
ncbi:MAG: hypothetical protein V7784_19900 [Oceanospirillaceae bacterium]